MSELCWALPKKDKKTVKRIRERAKFQNVKNGPWQTT